MIKKILVGGVGVLLGGAMLAVGGSAHALNLGLSGSATNSAQANINVGAGLQSQIQAITTNTSSVNAVVQLQGNTANLIQTNDDLTAYNNLVIKARPVITAITVHSDNSLAITYAQPAKLLNVFPTSLSGEVDVDAQGNTTVNMPWYGVFYAKDVADTQASVAGAIQQSGATFDASATATTQAQNTARVINAVTTTLQAETQAQASAS